MQTTHLDQIKTIFIFWYILPLLSDLLHKFSNLIVLLNFMVLKVVKNVPIQFILWKFNSSFNNKALSQLLKFLKQEQKN